MRRILATVLLASTAVPAAAEPAPLPQNWASEHDRQGEQSYRPPPHLRGIYGHGFSNPTSFDLDRPGNEPVCQGDRAAQEAWIARAGSYGTEFWFYATTQQGVRFTRNAHHDPRRPCSAGVRYSYDVERAFIADGMVHSLEIGNDRLPVVNYTRPLAAHDREYSGEFHPLHNLLARGPEPSRGRRSNQRVAGLRAQCWVVGGLVWSRLCLSRNRGPTYGMILATSAGDDERIMFHMEFDRLETDVELDGRLFELDRAWRGPD